jgi:hypothetical protein
LPVIDDKQNQTGPLEDPDIGALYRATRTMEPGTELDALILARARTAARRRRNRWLLPLSSAAVVMLGLTLTLQLLEQEPTLPSVEDYAVDEAVESIAAPQKSIAGKKEKQAQPGQAVREAASSLQQEDAGLRLRKLVPVEEPASPAAAGRAAVPQGVRAQAEEEQPAEQTGEFVEALPLMEPGPWLANISEMVDGGEIDKAIAELQRFQTRYPGYAIPEALQHLKRSDVE